MNFSAARPTLAWSVTLIDGQGTVLARVVVVVNGGAAVAVIKALEALHCEHAEQRQRLQVTAAEARSERTGERRRFRIDRNGNRLTPLRSSATHP